MYRFELCQITADWCRFTKAGSKPAWKDMAMKAWLPWLLLATGLAGCAQKDRWPQRILVPKPPVQRDLVNGKSWTHKGYLLKALAEFDVTGRVLLLEKFSSGREADLSPEDLSLGWGEMSNGAYLSQIKLAHIDRYYQWEIRGEVPTKETIVPNSANMHFIPATDGVASILKAVRVQDLVRAQGYLVSVNAPDGWNWSSSVSRSDTGTGACELLWVDKLEVLLTPP